MTRKTSGELAKSASKSGDLPKSASKSGDPAKSASKSGDLHRSASKSGDVLQSASKSGDAPRSASKPASKTSQLRMATATNSKSGQPTPPPGPPPPVAPLFESSWEDDVASLRSQKTVGFAASTKDSQFSRSIASIKPPKVPCNSRAEINKPCGKPSRALPSFEPDVQAICGGQPSEKDCIAFIRSLQRPHGHPSIKKLLHKDDKNVSPAKAKDNAKKAEAKEKDQKKYKEALKVLREKDKSVKDCEDFVKALRRTLAGGRLSIDDVMKSPLERAGFTEADLQALIDGPTPNMDALFADMQKLSQQGVESQITVMNKMSAIHGENFDLMKRLRELYEAFLLWLWNKMGYKTETLVKELKYKRDEGSLLSSLSKQELANDKAGDYGLIRRYTKKKDVVANLNRTASKQSYATSGWSQPMSYYTSEVTAHDRHAPVRTPQSLTGMLPYYTG